MLKTGYFILEGLNSFSTVYYAYYLFFYMQKVFGFDNKANLALAAFYGLTYMLAAWWGGRFAQRFGYFTALKLGFVIMIAALACGARVDSAFGQVVVMAATVIGMCFTWPTLEALISEGEAPAGLQRMVGIYNIVWAGTGAISYFIGGAMLDHFGLKSIFYVPVAIQFAQLAFTLWLEKQAHARAGQGSGAGRPALTDLNPRPIAKARCFLRMAWWANPFAYIAINTLVAVIPGLAQRFGLSVMFAGFCCSIWCFARLLFFIVLWLSPSWHYRFRWLLSAYVAMIGAFAGILLAPNLAVLVVAQLFFGVAAGLIYYSSLFYSMDVGDTKGEHGGFHEAAIGLGNFVGPGIGAVSLYFLPRFPNSGALAVTSVLVLGLGGLVAIWQRGKGDKSPCHDA